MKRENSHKPIFDFEAVFEPDDYLYFYADAINEERTKKKIEFLVKELELDKPMKILDLACGHGRHANLLHLLLNINRYIQFGTLLNQKKRKL